MKGRLATLGISAGGAGALIGAGYAGAKLGFIKAEVWFFLWPSLVAAVFLALAIVVLMMGAKRWLWPLGVGFVVQTIGVVLLALEEFDDPWDTLKWTLGAVFLVLAIMGIIALVVFIRARMLEKQLLDLPGGETGVDPRELEEIRNKMSEALTLLRRAAHGRNAIYELPWFLVIGRPAAGKTVAIKKSGLSLPVRKDWTKGDGGNHTCEWFFTNEMIFLDTPGAWVNDGASEEAQAYWQELLRRVRKTRGRRPLDGLVVVVPADDLLSLDDRQIQDQAANIREVMDLLQQELQFRFPVYLLVSKSDLIEGFADFFHRLPAQRRHEILGWSNPDPSREDVPHLIEKGSRDLMRRLGAYRLDMLAKNASVRRNKRLYFYPEEFKRVIGPLTTFADVLFHDDPSSERPVFRGFYFTSGTQEGAPLSGAMTTLAKTLGVPQRAAQPGEEAESSPRAYFLLELFRDLLVGDEGLVGRTAYHWWRQRRNTAFAAFLPATVGFMVLVLSLISYSCNGRLYDRIERNVPALATELANTDFTVSGETIVHSLGLTGQIADYHNQLVGFAPFRTFGMRQPGDLDRETLRVFRQEFETHILRPTFSMAQAYMELEGQCAPRIEVLSSIVWLGKGRRKDWDGVGLAGLNRVWQLNPEDSRTAQAQLLRQYKKYKPEDVISTGSLLPGFSLAEASNVIAEDCAGQGSFSSLRMYNDFQVSCPDPTRPTDVAACMERLYGALNRDEQDMEAFGNRYALMKKDLLAIQEYDPQAVQALANLGDIVSVDQSKCMQDFSKNVRPGLLEYVDMSKELAQRCEQAVTPLPKNKRWAATQTELKDQDQKLGTMLEPIQVSIENFNQECRAAVREIEFSGVTFEPVQRTSYNYRYNSCLGRQKGAAPTQAVPVRRVTPTPGRAQKPATSRPPSVKVQKPKRQVAMTSLDYFERPAVPKSNATVEDWALRQADWSMELEAIAQDVAVSPERQKLERRRIAGEVNGFAKRYADRWKTYLDGIRLRSATGAVPGWLGDLSKSTEWSELLSPAVTALAAAEEGQEAPFDAMSKRLRGLKGLPAFQAEKLDLYLQLLDGVAQDLDRTEKELQYLSRYQRGVRQNDTEYSLPAAIAWVNKNAGPGLAGGALTDLFMEPLTEARKHILSTNRIEGYWRDLRSTYNQIFRSFPIGGIDSLDADPVTPDQLKALLGGSSGLVGRLRTLAAGGGISTEAQAWLDRAQRYSDILYVAGTDDPKTVKLTLAIRAPRFSSEDLQKSHRVAKVDMLFDLVQKNFYQWSPDPEEEMLTPLKEFDLHFLGEEASETSALFAMVQKKKGFFKRVPFTGAYKKSASDEVVRVEGMWAPLRLLVEGLPGGLENYDGGPVSLEFKVPIEVKKDPDAAAIIPFDAKGKEIQELMLLLKEGLAEPPRNI